jgi:uncharacterized protein YsxB (DUF464 family)
MTHIKWYWEDDDFGICAEGHAEYNPGNDIVCSAVSTLLQTLWAGLEVCCFTPVEHKQESGKFVLNGKCRYPHKDRAVVVFDTILYGLELIAEQYPENVKIERVRGEGETPSDTL